MSKIDILLEKSRRAEQGGGAGRIEKQKSAGKLTARERIDFFFGRKFICYKGISFF